VKVTVRLFALAKQRVGRPQVELEMFEGATIGDLKRALAENHPALAPLIPNLMFAVDAQYATNALPIPPGAEVAAIPPVSGGGPGSTDLTGPLP
jgi:molybdopterin converting factor small subunit